jgi:hypothetical protein
MCEAFAVQRRPHRENSLATCLFHCFKKKSGLPEE